MNHERYLVTGAAGFIGFHVARRLLSQGAQVFGLDNLNAYYSPALKRARLEELLTLGLEFDHCDLADASSLNKVFEKARPEVVLHFAAQAGVRYSIDNPRTYIDSNLVGFANLLEGCRTTKPAHLLYASSSSVYGANTPLPFEENTDTDQPLNLYAATKKSNELLAYAYSHLFKIPATGLRFFTVYGPWGRPDMAYYSFTERFFAGSSITVHSDGAQAIRRSFTYIDDAVEAVIRLVPLAPKSDDPHFVVNIGSPTTITLREFIQALEGALSRETSTVVNIPKQTTAPTSADMLATHASVRRLHSAIGSVPETGIHEGLLEFVQWYLKYNRIYSPAGAL